MTAALQAYCIHFFFYSNSHPSLIHLPSFGLSFSFCASWVVPGVKSPPANAGDPRETGLIPGWGRHFGVGNGSTLQYSYLENSMNRGSYGLQLTLSQRPGMTMQLHTCVPLCNYETAISFFETFKIPFLPQYILGNWIQTERGRARMHKRYFFLEIQETVNHAKHYF